MFTFIVLQFKNM